MNGEKLNTRFATSLLVLWIAFASNVLGANVRAQLDGEPPKVAEPFWLTVSVSAAENSSVVFPEVPSTIGPFDVLSHKDWFDVPVGNARSWTRHFQLESLQSGEFEIPPIGVSVNGETISSEVVAVSINSMVEANADPFKFRDIKKTIEIPEEQSGNYTWVAWVASGLAIAAVLGFAYWAFYRKTKLSESQLALLQLARLRGSHEFQRGDAISVSPKVADLLRGYIERRFDIAATRQTTNEFLNSIQRDQRLDEAQRNTLRSFLQHTDEIKFAQLDPREGHLSDSFRIAEDFVRSSGTEAP